MLVMPAVCVLQCVVLFFSQGGRGRTGNQTDNLETYEGERWCVCVCALTYKSDYMRLK